MNTILLPGMLPYVDITQAREMLVHAPWHVCRDLTLEILPSAKEALNVLANQFIPTFYEIREGLDIKWMAHVCESSKVGDFEHYVIPKPLYDIWQDTFLAAGFRPCDRGPKIETVNGLREALEHGADVNKKWH